MNVRFRRTGVRRYAVVVTVAGEPPRAMDPAPAYDDDIPHDLVHYVVEASWPLRMESTDAPHEARARSSRPQNATSARGSARARNASNKDASELWGLQDARHAADMAQSERLAALCDVAWRRKHGQHPDPARSAPVPPTEDAADVERVVSRLDAIAPLWRALPVGGELVFEWPSVVPTTSR